MKKRIIIPVFISLSVMIVSCGTNANNKGSDTTEIDNVNNQNNKSDEVVAEVQEINIDNLAELECVIESMDPSIRGEVMDEADYLTISFGYISNEPLISAYSDLDEEYAIGWYNWGDSPGWEISPYWPSNKEDNITYVEDNGITVVVDKGSTEYHENRYDQNGKRISSTDFWLDYNFDDDEEYSNGEIYELVDLVRCYSIYEYDNAGRMIKEKRYYDDESAPSYVTDYYYDENQKITYTIDTNTEDNSIMDVTYYLRLSK